MPSALILIADGTEEIEFVTPYDVLTRAEFSVRSVGINLQHQHFAMCSRGVRITPDVPDIAKLSYLYSDPDVLVVPGGAGGAASFCGSKNVLEMIQKLRGQAKWVACICAGTTALVRSANVPGLFPKKKCRVTSHPSVKQEIIDQEWPYEDESVVVDDKVITSRGPGTALLFALAIVESILGREKRDEVAGPMLLPET